MTQGQKRIIVKWLRCVSVVVLLTQLAITVAWLIYEPSYPAVVAFLVALSLTVAYVISKIT